MQMPPTYTKNKSTGGTRLAAIPVPFSKTQAQMYTDIFILNVLIPPIYIYYRRKPVEQGRRARLHPSDVGCGVWRTRDRPQHAGLGKKAGSGHPGVGALALCRHTGHPPCLFSLVGCQPPRSGEGAGERLVPGQHWRLHGHHPALAGEGRGHQLLRLGNCRRS